VGTLGLLIGLPPLVRSIPFATPESLGRGIFDELVGAAFLLCCAACLLTADTISGERREGTLGLLLLMRVRGFDILLGKFGSSALTSVEGLVAVLPVLMLPLLAGGVTAGEAARQGLALCDTLFLALSVGLWASARGWERLRTARAAAVVTAGLVLGPSVLGGVFSRSHLELASPLGTVLHAADAAYRTSAARYWLSLGLVQLGGWMLLLGAPGAPAPANPPPRGCFMLGGAVDWTAGADQREITGGEPLSPRQLLASILRRLVEIIHQARRWPPIQSSM